MEAGGVVKRGRGGGGGGGMAEAIQEQRWK